MKKIIEVREVDAIRGMLFFRGADIVTETWNPPINVPKNHKVEIIIKRNYRAKK